MYICQHMADRHTEPTQGYGSDTGLIDVFTASALSPPPPEMPTLSLSPSLSLSLLACSLPAT